jgi:putative Mn2+ efflux pump MntP
MPVVLEIGVIALSLALDVFAVSVATGAVAEGTGPRTILRMGLVFAAAEIGMNLIGAAIGRAAGEVLGGVAAYVGYGALVAVGFSMVRHARALPRPERRLRDRSNRILVLTALALSIDSLGVGFSLLYLGVPIALTLAAVGAASLAATAAGLTLGGALGRHVGEHAELAGGLLLATTGVVFAVGRFSGHGF